MKTHAVTKLNEKFDAYLKCDLLHYTIFNTIVSRDGFGDVAVGAPGKYWKIPFLAGSLNGGMSDSEKQ